MRSLKLIVDTYAPRRLNDPVRGALYSGFVRFQRWARPDWPDLLPVVLGDLGMKMAKQDPEARWFVRLRSSPVGLTVSALVALLIGAAAATDAFDKLLIWSGVKPNALQLAEDNDRGRFSRDLTRSAWRRLFWMRRQVLAMQ